VVRSACAAVDGVFIRPGERWPWSEQSARSGSAKRDNMAERVCNWSTKTNPSRFPILSHLSRSPLCPAFRFRHRVFKEAQAVPRSVRYVFWIVAFSPHLGSLGGCSDDASRVPSTAPTTESDEHEVAQIVALLRSMPDWTGLPLFEERQEERNQIEAIMYKMGRYDLDTIRAAVEKYDRESNATGAARIAAEGRLFVLNRFLFNLPRTVRLDSPHSRNFGGCWFGELVVAKPGSPEASDQLVLRWPWSEDQAGNWRLTGRCMGFSGPPYQPLEAFDYYRKEFGKRAIVQSQPTRGGENRVTQPG